MEKKKIQTYKDLQIWQRSMELVASVYTLTEKLPQQEQYGLISQIRRCSVSIPSNIAEGSGRGSPKDFAQFLRIARGSLYELDTQLLLMENLFKEPTAKPREEIQQLIKMTTTIIKSLMKIT
jgi:four helix bundle protein